jgi:hypothetical protein
MNESARPRFRLPHWGWFLLPPVVLAIGFVSLSIWWPHQREQMVIQKIQNWGGSVETENGRIISIKLSGRAVTDSGLVHLVPLQNLEQLDLEGTQTISDAGLVHLGRLKNLAILSLDDTPITDAGLSQLARFRNLYFLQLKGTHVTDDGIQSFYRELPTCQINRR